LEIVIIGNGVAGNTACSAIRSRTNKVKVTLLSDEPYPFYSPCLLTHYISKEVKRSQVFLKSLKDYEKGGINVLLGYRVGRIDPTRKKVFLPGRELTYDKLILATGSKAIIPPIEGVNKKGVMVLKSLKDADRLFRDKAKKAIIVGSGPIGVGLAVALRKRNWDVCLIEVLDWILPNLFDEKGSSMVREILEKEGIEVLTGERVLAIKGGTYVNEVVSSGIGRKEANIVVFAVGMQPSTELARQAGIEIGELGGICTNDEMETSIKDIYACGDCVESKDLFTQKSKLSLLWSHAERQGTVVGCNVIGEHRSIRWMCDVINLDIFGTFAGAIGQPARIMDATKTEALEKKGMRHYHSLVISEGRVVGSQFIGDYEGMGVLFPLMGKNYEEIYRQIKNEEVTVPLPWYFSARDFFSN
jgi:NADH oxidase (H2O2-forming)